MEVLKVQDDGLRYPHPCDYLLQRVGTKELKDLDLFLIFFFFFKVIFNRFISKQRA